MKAKFALTLFLSLFILTSILGLLTATASPPVAPPPAPLADNPAPPANPVKLIFIHHSTGGNWLADLGEHEQAGGLGQALMDNNYFVSATNYGWGPGGIGDRTDIPNWPEWFTDGIMNAVYAETGQNIGDFGNWPRMADPDPGGENTIVVFKSCFPNSNLYGNPNDPPYSEPNDWEFSVSNVKAVYNEILTYFAAHQDKLFIVITAPPMAEGEYTVLDPGVPAATRAANARAFNNWLLNDWLASYPHHNVAVFDYYNVLTSNGSPARIDDTSVITESNDYDLRPDGNHHYWNGSTIVHPQTINNNFAAYPSYSGGPDWYDSHPMTNGQQKATAEFIPLLNIYYNRWAGSDPQPVSDVWVVDDSVRLDPVTGTLIEERHSSGEIGPGYRSLNPVWNGHTIQLMSARNEVVAFQVIVDGGPHTGVSLEVSNLTGPGTLTASDHVRRFKEWFLPVTAESDFCDFAGENYVDSLGLGWYPDPLIPLDEPGPPAAGYGQPFDIPDAQNGIPGQTAVAFWVDVLVPTNTPTGDYHGTVTVNLDGNTTTLPLNLEVRNLTLAAENHAGLGSVNYGGLNFHVLWDTYPTPNDEGLQRWFQIAHAHRLELDAHWLWPLCHDGSLYPPCDPVVGLDWDMWRDLWQPYMTGSAFTTAAGYWGPSAGQPIRRFLLPQDFNWPTGDADSDSRPDDEAAWQESLRDVEAVLINEGWTDIEAQLWFHPTDEPHSLEQFELINYYGDLVETANLVDRNHITHRADLGFFKNIGDVIPGWTTDTIFTEIGDDIDTWNVLASHYSIGVDEMANRLAANPDEQWWFYTSCVAGEPAVGAPYIEGEALGMRTWGWIVYRYQMQGGVTWEMDAGYDNLPGCWADPQCAGWGINGDAVLFYAGWTIGLPDYQPVASIRLKNLRRGSQDYEYLYLLEAYDGNRDRADSLAASVVFQALDDGLEPGVDEPPGRWAHNPLTFEDARRQVADWLDGGSGGDYYVYLPIVRRQ